MKRFILGIDPGTTETAYCLCKVEEITTGSKPPLSIIRFDKAKNDEVKEELLKAIKELSGKDDTMTVAIEHLESYGTAVGKSTFETAYYIGELRELCFCYELSGDKLNVERIYRHEEKMRICHSMKANDATIKRMLVDTFSKNPDKNYGKGTKSDPDFFYGFKADCWSAFAICCTQWLKENDRYLC